MIIEFFILGLMILLVLSFVFLVLGLVYLGLLRLTKMYETLELERLNRLKKLNGFGGDDAVSTDAQASCPAAPAQGATVAPAAAAEDEMIRAAESAAAAEPVSLTVDECVTGLIFLCVSADGVLSSNGTLSDSFLLYMAKIRDATPHLTIVSPIVQDYAMFPGEKLATRDEWGQRCERLIKLCDEVWVIQNWGWSDAPNVQIELALSSKYGKTVRHFSPGSKFHLN